MMSSKRIKVLVFIDWYSPGYKAGGPIRSCLNLIARLSEEIDFHVVTRDTDYIDSEPYKEVKSNEWVKSLEQNANVFYISSKNLSIQTIRRIINSSHWDCIYLNHVFSFYFSIIPLLFSKKIKVVIAPRGAYADGALSVKSKKKTMYIHLANSLRLYKNVFFQATTETEKDQIEKYVRNYQKVLVAQNLPSKENSQVESEIVKEIGTLKLFYLARISPEKNLLFALEILNKKKYAGQITFDIYGAINDDKYWNRCQGVINDLPSNIRVEYKGSIKSSDINGVILNYHFLYLPTLGENFGHSILESLLMNVPVIISDQTPWNQLSSQNIGWDVVLKEDAFIEIISNALRLNNDSYQSMRISCEKYVQNFLSNSVQVEQSKQMFL